MSIGKMIIKMKIRQLDINGNDGSVCAFTTERGAADCFNPYSEFNCCDYTGDVPEHYEACREELRKGLGVVRLLLPRQVHSVKVAVADDAFFSMSEEAQIKCLDGVDAVVTDRKGVVAGVYTADCVPMLFYDVNRRIVAAAHAGWKGTMNGIATETLKAMAAMGSRMEDIKVMFGPSICRNCFEVGDEVVEQFAEKPYVMEDIMVRHPVTGKAHIDLVAANRFWMLRAGVPMKNITASGLCTRCQPERFFSARALGVKSGRIVTGIVLR